MSRSSDAGENRGVTEFRREHYLAALGIFSVYLGLRVFTWTQTALLEDHDSVALMLWAEPFARFDLIGILQLDPDASLFYPLLIGLFSLPGWSFEAGARLATLASSAVLFGSVLGIGRQIASPGAVLIGLMLLAVNPELVRFSIAVLTEPTYVATVYVGLLLFWLQYRRPTLIGAAALGVVFGLAFLNRMEGILFVVFVPFMLTLYYLWEKPQDYDFKWLVVWCLLFLSVFLALAVAHVWRVSHEMGAFAINGRQAWTLLLNSPPAVGDWVAYNERLYGLDFDPAVVNIVYVKQHFSAVLGLTTGNGESAELLLNYIKALIVNLDDLYSRRLTDLFGHLVIVLFVFGLVHLYAVGRVFDVTLIIVFLALVLIAPLLHNVVVRHILVMAPIVLVVSGIGVVSLSKIVLTRTSRWPISVGVLAGVITAVVIAGWAMPLRGVFNPPDRNDEYSMAELREPIRIIAESFEGDRGRPPRVATRQRYLPYFSGAEWVALPFVEFDGLVAYSKLNEVDFVYLTHQAEIFPFAPAFDGDEYGQMFTLLYRHSSDVNGRMSALYRFNGGSEE